MLEELKRQVYKANLELPRRGLVTFTWGNASGIDRASGLFVTKPSGVEYDLLQPEDMVVIDMAGVKVEGQYKPSSDTATHLELYRRFPALGGVVHTHSTWATVFAQAERPIPCYGTTHADYFHGAIPCTRLLSADEIEANYELNTGMVIAETLRQAGFDPLEMPAIVASKHGPFTWGATVDKAVENAVVLEEVARMAWLTETLSPGVCPAPEYLLEKHYTRKHGPKAYYGQR